MDLNPLDDAAAQYVEAHRLEEHLSTAVDVALQRKSDNPLEVIVEHLQKVIAGGAPSAGEKRQKTAPSKSGARSNPLALEIHVKARSQENPDYPARAAVSDEEVRWSAPLEGYSPPDWTHQVVHANARDAATGHKWADPADVSAMKEELEGRTTFATGNGDEATFKEALEFDEVGRPLNPVGRTGLAGRGLLGKWGSNHAADPIVTRFHPVSGKLQVVAIQRKDTKQWAIPGGMVDPGEAVSVTVKREFTEEAGAIEDEAERAQFEADTAALFDHGGVQVYRGYVDDPRATDHAWMETTAFHFHCSTELGSRIPLKAGDDAGQVMWLDVSMANPIYRDLYGAHRAMIDEALFGMWSRGELDADITHRSKAVAEPEVPPAE